MVCARAQLGPLGEGDELDSRWHSRPLLAGPDHTHLLDFAADFLEAEVLRKGQSALVVGADAEVGKAETLDVLG